MQLTKIKQGTLEWEKARATRIGSSEIFDIVRYYATEDELQNCGINAENFRAEEPYTTVWALYHKMLGDGLYKREALAPSFAEYGHAVEPYGIYKLQRGRAKKIRAGEVYIDEKLIASLDSSGTAEEIDIIPFDFGSGNPEIGQTFACEQKTMRPDKAKNGMPYKYIIQAQYQIMETKKDFFILQIMILDEDDDFIRGKICQMSRKKKFEYLDEHLAVTHYYFQNNVHLSRLIEECIKRFFDDVDNRNEPTPFIWYDSQKNIIDSIRANSLFNEDATFEYDLSEFEKLKAEEEEATTKRKAELQNIIELAKHNNVCRFRSENGTVGWFIKTGAFRLKYPAEVMRQ